MIDSPQQKDLDRCVHCGLCLNACPTYRELGVEMDSPRGRIYQMNEVASGAPISDSYREHIDLCLACRACETACPSGVEYGKLIEAARAQIESVTTRPWHIRVLRMFLFQRLLPSRALLSIAGCGLWLYQTSGLQRLVRASGILGPLGLKQLEQLSPSAQPPFFFDKIGKTFPAIGPKRYRVALMAGCIANVSFARLNEATVRVLQRYGCEVVIPEDQTCCGALHLHSGLADDARALARRNIASLDPAEFDAILTNAAGCGSTLKEYGELLHHDAAADAFAGKMRDVLEFLAPLPMPDGMKTLKSRVTYQDSCHLLHGQKIRKAPRELLKRIPGVDFREMPGADLCCGSAGVYNVLHTDMAHRILKDKMDSIALVSPDTIATANPGCLLQLEAGARVYGKNQRVAHVIELLDEALR